MQADTAMAEIALLQIEKRLLRRVVQVDIVLVGEHELDQPKRVAL